MKCGIYKIIIGDEFYIGSSIDIDQRWNNHIKACNNNRCNKKMSAAFQKNPSLEFEIIEECAKDVIFEREQFYIDTLKPPLNIAPIAGKAPGYSKECRLKDPFGEIHKFESLKHACMEHNLCIGSLSDLLNGNKDEHKGWVREEQDHKKVRRRGVLDPNNNRYIVENVKEFCKRHNISMGSFSRLLSSKMLHYRGWRLPEHKDIVTGWEHKELIKDGVIIKFNNPMEVKTHPELKAYNLRHDSLLSLIAGRIKNHKGWEMLTPPTPYIGYAKCY